MQAVVTRLLSILALCSCTEAFQRSRPRASQLIQVRRLHLEAEEEQLPPLPPLVSPGATSTSGGAIQNTSVTTTSAATSATSSSMTTSETTTAVASSTTSSSMTTSETTTQVETSTSSTADEAANETTTSQASSTTSSSMTTSETTTQETSTSSTADETANETTTPQASSTTSSSMTTSETTTQETSTSSTADETANETTTPQASSTTNSSMTTSETTTQVETSTSSTADETANETTTPQASSTTSSSMTTSETATPVATTTSQVATTTTTTSTAEPPTSAPTKSAATTTTSTISSATAENTTVAATTTTSTTGQSTTEVWGAWTKGGDDVEDKVTENVTEGPNATDVASEAGEAVKAAGAAAKAIWDGLTGSGNASEVANSTAAAAEAVKEAAKTAAQAIFGPSGPKTTVQVTIEANSVPEEEYLTTGVQVKLKATMQTLAEELDAEAGHADADTELKLRVMAMDAVRQSRGLLDGTMLRLVAFNCSAPGLRSFELSTGVDLQKALHEVTTTVDGVCVLKGSPKAADVAAQKVLDTALLQAVARQHAAALSETNKAVRGAHTALKQLQSEALQMQPNSTLLRAVKEVLESHRNSSESLAKAIEKVNATMAPKAKIIRTQMRMKLLERLRVYRNLALFGLQGTLEAGARFAGGLRKVLPVPSLGAWAVQLGEAELGVNRTLEAYNSFRAAAAAAEDAKVEAETVKVESEKASEAASEYEAVAQNRSLEAQKMRDEMNVPGAVVNTTEIDILDGEAKVAADAAGSQKREDEQLQLLYQQLLQEIAGNLSQEVALAKTVEGSLEAVVGASMVADLQSAGAAEFAKTSLRHMNASKHRPVSLLDIQGAGEAGNVTVRVDIFSQNASEIHEVIEALERRLKATFISDFAAAIRWRSQEYATAGHLRMSALVGSLDSAVIGDVANTTAETIHDVLGNVVTDIQKVQIAGLPNVSGEGLPIHAPSPADEAKAPSTGRPPTEEAEEAEASSLSTPQAHGSVRGPWSFVGLVGIAVLGVLGLLLVIVNRCTG